MRTEKLYNCIFQIQFYFSLFVSIGPSPSDLASLSLSKVGAAVPPQSLRGGPLSQLLPRQPVPHLGQLLSEQGLLRPGAHQRVERHAGPAVVPRRLARALL